MSYRSQSDGDRAGHVFHSARDIADPPKFHAAARLLRHEDPVHRVEDPNYNPFYALTKYEDVRTVGASSRTMLNGPRAILGDKKFDAQVVANGRLVKTLVHMDDPQHQAHRRLISDWFRPKNLNAMQTRIDAFAEKSVEEMRNLNGQCDFAADIAMQFPLRVILSLLGLPESDYQRMLKLTQEIFGPEDPEHARDETAVASLMATIRDFVEYFTALSKDRQANPTEDLASTIANGTIDGEPIDLMEQIGHYVLIATAGHDTTSSAISGGLLALIEHPDQLKLLQSDMSLIPSAVDEMIRWTSPVKHFMRTANEECKVGEKTIRAGEDLLLSFWAANFDEDFFEHPERFSVTREERRHLAFGFGAHSCLGRVLAKMEIESFFRALLPRLRHIELNGEPAWTPSTFVSGLKRLPIRYELD
jgi:cytochrome P450